MKKNYHDIRRRVAAIVLSLLMLLQAMPMGALAEGFRAVTSNADEGGDTYAVNFVVDGEAYGNEEIVEAGVSIDAPTDPSKTDYRFLGWSTAEDSTDVVEFPYTPAGDVTFYAQFAEEYRIEWKLSADDTENFDVTRYIAGEKVGESLPDAPVKEGTTFRGWFTDPADASTQITADSEFTASATVYARYDDDMVVTFMVNDAKYSEQRYTEPGTAIGTLPQKPFVSGYRFQGWYRDVDDESTAVTEQTEVNESFTATAKLEDVRVFSAEVTYYYIYNGNRTNFDTTILQLEKSDLSMTITSPASTREFDQDSDPTGKVLYPSQPTITLTMEDLDAAIAEQPDADMVTIRKEVEFVEYTVEYVQRYMLKDLTGDGYSKIEDVPGYGVLGAVITPEIREYAYATFESADTAAVTENGQVLNVYYTRRDFTLTFEVSGGDYVPAVTDKYGAQVTLPDTATRRGYTFDGWYLDEALTQSVSGSVTLEGNTTVYAKWTPSQVDYTIVYMVENADDDGYSFLAAVTKQAATDSTVTMTAATAGANGTRPSQLDTTNFTFKDSTTETIAADGSTVVVVRYTRNVYTIVWNGKGYYNNYYGAFDSPAWRNSHELYLSNTFTLTAKYGANISAQWASIFNTSHGTITIGKGNNKKTVSVANYCWNFSSSDNNQKFTSLEIMPSLASYSNGTREVYIWYYTQTKIQYYYYWLENYESTLPSTQAEPNTKTRNGRTYGLLKKLTVSYNWLPAQHYPDYEGYTKGGFVRSDGKTGIGNNSDSTNFSQNETTVDL